MDRLSELPLEILHKILYFLSQKEAVRTSVLSKSWRYIGSTRPNLDFSDILDSSFSDRHFNRKKQEFISVVDETLQRYCDQRLRIEEFHLSIYVGDSHDSDDSDEESEDEQSEDDEAVSLLEKWIPLLTTMGVKSRLSICPDDRIWVRARLPPVVFGAKDLHVHHFELDKKDIKKIILSNHLRSLHLEYVEMDDNILQKIISKCPSIETIGVKRCGRLRTIKLNGLHNLKSFSFIDNSYPEDICSIEFHPPSLFETVKIQGGDIRFHPRRDFRNLNDLSLCDVKSSFDQSSSFKLNIWFHQGMDFRNLNDLSLCDVKSPLDQLSSFKFPSLKRLAFSRCDGLKESHLFIDAPNILWFKYVGFFVPSISFATTCREWNSEIYLHTRDASSSWFLMVKELLKSLSQSFIHLAIDHYKRIIQENINVVQDINGYNNKPVVVESLSLNCYSCSLSSLLDGAFGICRPRKVDSYPEGPTVIEFVGLMWKILMERKCESLDQFTLELLFRDLEEASFEIKEHNNRHSTPTVPFPEYLRNCRVEWRPAAAFSDFLVNYRCLECRFALKWRE